MANQISLRCIRELDERQQQKTNQTLLDIAETYARVYKFENEDFADISVHGESYSFMIDKDTATAFRKGDLSMHDLIIGILSTQKERDTLTQP